MYVRTGLGSMEDLPQGVLGTGPVDCRKYMTWAYTPECWKYSPSAWEQIVSFTRPTSGISAHVPAVPEAYGTVAAPYDCEANPAGSPNCPGYDAAIDAAIAAGKAETDKNIAAFFEAQPYVPETAGIASIPTWMWIAGGVGVFALVAMGGGSPRRYGR